MFRFFVVLAFIIVGNFYSLESNAQNGLHSIELGIYSNPSLNEFRNVSDLGYVFSEPYGKNHSIIYLGPYEEKAVAQEILTQIKKKGYKDATIKSQTPMSGKMIKTIQLASVKDQNHISWAKFKNLKSVYLFFDKNRIKIVTGKFEDDLEANSYLNEVRKLGFKDAFTKTIYSSYLHLPTLFERSNEDLSLVSSPEFTSKGVSKKVAARKSMPSKVCAIPRMPKAKFDTKRKRNSISLIQKLINTNTKKKLVVDGYYGNNTEEGIKLIKRNSYSYKKSYEAVDSWMSRGDFYDWKEIRVMVSLLKKTYTPKVDMNQVESKKLAALVMQPKKLGMDTITNSMSWDYRVRKSLNSLEVNEKSTAMKLSYYESRMLLENYFLQKLGNSPHAKNSEGLAIACLKLMLGDDIVIN